MALPNPTSTVLVLDPDVAQQQFIAHQLVPTYRVVWAPTLAAVSYTHLTLPTILRV